MSLCFVAIYSFILLLIIDAVALLNRLTDLFHPQKLLARLQGTGWEQGVFFLLLLVFLIPIWQGKYFLTGDGPTHLYNSEVLKDLVLGVGGDFYGEYYSVNQNFEPNWFSHIVLGTLLTVLPGFLAEKLFLTLYVVLFAVSFRGLIRQFNPQGALISILAFPFIYQKTFQMGFYNFSFSVVFLLLILGAWMRWRGNFNPGRQVRFGLLYLLLFLSHPVSFLYSLPVLGLLWLGEGLPPVLKGKAAWGPFMRLGGRLLLAVLPAMGLMVWFVVRKGTETFPNPDTFHSMWHAFLQLTSLEVLKPNETFWAQLLTATVGFGVLVLAGYRIWYRNWQLGDVFFLAFVLTLAAYFLAPGGFAGAGILSIRLQFYPWLFLVLWLGTGGMPRFSVYGASLTGLVIALAFMWIRIPEYARLNAALDEYLSATAVIPEGSTVLTLSYHHNGVTPEHEMLAPRIWLFMHAGDYMGVEKNLILFGNYEANTGNFPLLWQPERNPFTHISVLEGQEFLPPRVDFLTYPERTGGRVDYVLTWCKGILFQDHAFTKSVDEQLAEGYRAVFVSENELVRVYKRQ